MRNNILVFVCFMGCAFVGCSSEKYNDDLTLLNPLEQTTKISDLSPYISSAEIIKLEETENSLLTYAKKVLLTQKGNFIVQDMSGVVKVFDKGGKYLFTVGRKGRGPGEYLTAWDICLNNEQDCVMVLSLGYVYFYDVSNGQFISQIETPRKNYDAVCPAKDDGFFLFASNPGQMDDFDDKYYAMNLFDSKGAQMGECLPRKDYVFTQGIFTQSYDNNYFLRPQEGDNVLYKVIGNKIEPVMRIDFGSKTIPNKYIFKEGGIKNIQGFIKSNYYKLPMYFHNTHNQLLFTCAGPGGNYNFFIFSFADMHGLWWEDIEYNSAPILFMASDSDYFYAIIADIRDYDDITTVRNPMDRYVKDLLKSQDIIPNGNPLIVKLKFDFNHE